MQRIGKKGQAYFRLVVTEHTTRPKGEYLELLGSYDPHKNSMDVKADRVKHWMSKGAKLSATANNLLVGRKFIEGEKVQVWKAKKSDKPQETSDKAIPTPIKPAEVVPEPEPKTEPKEEAPTPPLEVVAPTETSEAITPEAPEPAPEVETEVPAK